jgi:hypothetical protein
LWCCQEVTSKESRHDAGSRAAKGLWALPPSLVRAARVHLTDRFARGIARLLWEEHKTLLSDTEAAVELIEAADGGQGVSAPDIAAALVVVHAARLDVDRLEDRVWRVAERAGFGPEQLAAVLGLPSAEEAEQHRVWLRSRAALPVDEVAGPVAGRAAQRAEQAAQRARQAGQRAQKAGEKARAAGRRRTELAGEYGIFVRDGSDGEDAAEKT